MTQHNAEVTSIENFGKWSLTQLAREFKMARETISKRLFSGNVESAGKRNGFPVYPVASAAKAILFPEQNKPGIRDSPDNLSPKDRLDYYKAENEKVKFGRETKMLVEVDDARVEMAMIAKSGLHILETLQDTLESDFDLDQDIIDGVSAKVDALRTQWAEMMLVKIDKD